MVAYGYFQAITFRINRPGHSRRSRKKFGFSEKSVYLAADKAPELRVSESPNDEIIDIHNLKRIAYREKSTLNYI